MELCTPRFLRSLITNLTSDFRNSKRRIQYGGHEILETLRFWHNSVLHGFWRRWLRICHRIFGIQNGGPNMADIIFWKANDFRGTLYSTVFEVADYEFDIIISEFNMAAIIFWKHNDFHGTLYAKVFEVTNYEFDIGFSELKMADPIWWTCNFGKSRIFT